MSEWTHADGKGAGRSRRISGDRPRAHNGTGEAERAIFEATERLLIEVPLHELSVAQIISAAGVSRATFYFYFSSKFAVVTGLLERVMDEIFASVQPFVGRPGGQPPEAALRQALQESTKVWAAHRHALGAVMEHWHAVPELRELWLAVVERFTAAVAAEIERERKQGVAPPGPDSRHVAACLIWGTERCLYVAGLGVDASIPREEDLVEPLMTLWLGVLYSGRKSGKPAREAKAPARRPKSAKRA